MKAAIKVPSNVANMIVLGTLALVVISGIGIPSFWPSWLLPVAGAFIGLCCVRDPKLFLIAGLALIAAKWGLRYVPVVGSYTQGIATELIKVVAPAMLIVAVRSIYDQIR